MKKQLTMPQYKELLRAVFRLQMKPDSNGEIEHMVVKLTPFSIAQCELFREFCPKAKFYFLTRNMEKTVLVPKGYF